MPEVKPNYEYFSQLLDLQSSICVRPKTCEVFVSSSEITLRDDVAYDSTGQALDQVSFPHLNKYKNCDDSPNVLGRDVLLHEYTRSLDRTTSACVKSVTRRWQKDAPAMYETLNLPSHDEECLLIEMCSTVELHEHAKFPGGSELTGFVEVAVTPSALQGHRWKCVTRLTRPDELHSDNTRHAVYTNESGIHRRGCSDSKPDCECHTRPRSDIHVPFPAVEWASILSMAVEYPDTEHQKKKDRHSRNHMSSDARGDLERKGSKRKRSEDEGDAASWAKRDMTASDLICKVAMYQELWSCAPDSGRWVRQAIIFWRFQTTNQWYKYKPVFKPAGTSWRWLTINDPMSRYHQQKALVYPSSQMNREAVMSPTPTLQQHQVANRSENFGSVWDNQVGSIPQMASIPASNSMSMFDSFANGLATPPPSASLHGSYPTNSFDPNMAAQSGSGMSFLPNGNDAQSAVAVSQGQSYFDGSASAFPDVKPLSGNAMNPYMPVTSSLDLSTHLVYDNSNSTTECSSTNGLQNWDMSAMESWTTPSSAAASAANVADWGAAANHHHHQPVSAKLETSSVASDPASMWPGTTPQWNLMAGAAPGSAAGTDRDDGSPRNMKRRRTEPFIDGHIPVSTAW